VENDGAKKFPLLRVTVLEDAMFFVMERSRGGSPSPTWWLAVAGVVEGGGPRTVGRLRRRLT
jgi:hypothetical protein